MSPTYVVKIENVIDKAGSDRQGSTINLGALRMTDTFVELTADIVVAYVARNAVAISDMPVLINNVHAALASRGGTSETEAEPQAPAVSIRASIKPDYLVCLEDGEKTKLLKGHLKRVHGMTPSEYREKWKLRASYPMVAPSYSERRRDLAIQVSLGRGARSATAGVKGKKATAAETAKTARASTAGKRKLHLP